MLKQIFTASLVFAFSACSDRSEDVNLQEKVNKEPTSNLQPVIFAQPLAIDSSQTIIYPLVLQKEGDRNFYSSSSGQTMNYWNLVFYNTATQSSHLLITDKKLVINGVHLGTASTYSDEMISTSGINIYRNFIIYTAIANDFNGSNTLGDGDPNYLFVSDRDGKNFRQVSPDNYHISSWQVVKGSTKIIMQAQKDSDGDKRITEKDAVVPLVADVSLPTTAIEIFRQDFTDSLKQQFIRTWKK